MSVDLVMLSAVSVDQTEEWPRAQSRLFSANRAINTPHAPETQPPTGGLFVVFVLKWKYFARLLGGNVFRCKVARYLGQNI